MERPKEILNLSGVGFFYVEKLEQQIKELKEEAQNLQEMGVWMLSGVPCPNCDGSGAVPTRDSEWEQCQWCYTKDTYFTDIIEEESDRDDEEFKRLPF